MNTIFFMKIPISFSKKLTAHVNIIMYYLVLKIIILTKFTSYVVVFDKFSFYFFNIVIFLIIS